MVRQLFILDEVTIFDKGDNYESNKKNEGKV